MLQVLSFILHCVIEFAEMLFTINIGDDLNLGLLCCILFIFLPMMLRIIYFLRSDVVEELNNRYDESRPIDSWTFSEQQHYNPKTGKGVRTLNSYHNQTKRRRYRI